MTKRIVLCADDYGQALEISQGIITLIKANRLSATTCLVNSPQWPEHAKWLIPFQDQIDIGLHVNLTEGRACSPLYLETYGECFFPLSTLMRKAFCLNLAPSAIVAECHAQLDRFVKAMGFLPRFLDGHQHIQQFPVIRDALLCVYQERLQQTNAYMRVSHEKIHWRSFFDDVGGACKKMVIYASGARAFQQCLAKHHIPHNHSFAGIYSFTKACQYKHLFRHFLQDIQDGGMIMCHPGLASSSETDSLTTSRYLEYEYLLSDVFLSDCEQHGVVLQRCF